MNLQQAERVQAELRAALVAVRGGMPAAQASQIHLSVRFGEPYAARHGGYRTARGLQSAYKAITATLAGHRPAQAHARPQAAYGARPWAVVGETVTELDTSVRALRSAVIEEDAPRFSIFLSRLAGQIAQLAVEAGDAEGGEALRVASHRLRPSWRGGLYQR